MSKKWLDEYVWAETTNKTPYQQEVADLRRQIRALMDGVLKLHEQTIQIIRDSRDAGDFSLQLHHLHQEFKKLLTAHGEWPNEQRELNDIAEHRRRKRMLEEMRYGHQFDPKTRTCSCGLSETDYYMQVRGYYGDVMKVCPDANERIKA